MPPLRYDPARLIEPHITRKHLHELIQSLEVVQLESIELRRRAARTVASARCGAESSRRGNDAPRAPLTSRNVYDD